MFLLNINNASLKKRHKLSFFLLSNMKSAVNYFSTMLYVVFFHNNFDLKYLFTVFSKTFVH